MNKELLEFLFVGPLFSIFKKLNVIERNQKDMATQAEVDALKDRIGAVGSTLSRGLDEVRSEIANLKDQVANAQPPVDLSGLEAAVDSVAGQAQALDDVVPDVIPEPEPEPVEEETQAEPTEGV